MTLLQVCKPGVLKLESHFYFYIEEKRTGGVNLALCVNSHDVSYGQETSCSACFDGPDNHYVYGNIMSTFY